MAALEAKKRFERDRWEQTRMIMYAALLPHQNKGGLKPSDVLDFHWDKVKKVEMTVAQKAEAEAARKARFAKWDAEAKAKKTNGKI